MTLPSIIGWLGVAVGVWVNVPQAWRIYKTRSCKDVSVWTYRLLLVCVICYFIKAVSIGEPVFIVSNGIGIVVTSSVLYLHWRHST